MVQHSEIGQHELVKSLCDMFGNFSNPLAHISTKVAHTWEYVSMVVRRVRP